MYKRKTRFADYYTSITTVSIYWSQKSDSYAIKFGDLKHFDKMKIMISYMKAQSYGEYEYDPENKIWYLQEKHIAGLRQMIEMLPEYFKLDFVEKPQGGLFQPLKRDSKEDFNIFQQVTSINISGLDYDSAKRTYRKWMLKNHPDIGGDSAKASIVNECWSNLEMNFYKKKEISYAND